MAVPRMDLTVAVAIAAVAPFLIPNPYVFDVVIRIGLAAIAAIGLNILMGFAGQISIGHAGFVGGAAYVSAILAGNYQWPAPAAIATSVTLMAAVGYLLARPMLRLSGHALTIATLGLGLIVHIVLVNEVAWTGGPDGMSTTPLAVGGFAVNSDLKWYALVAICLILAMAVSGNLHGSAAGRALRALNDSEIAARSMGVDVYSLKVRAFVASAVFAGLGGALTAHYSGFITPDLSSFLRSVELATMVVVGGRGSTAGAVLGAALLTALPQLLGGFADYEMVVSGLILMAAMIFLPEGIVPSLQARLKALMTRRGAGEHAPSASG